VIAQRFISTAASWLREGHRVVAATLVETEGSSPLELGATMLVDDSGRIDGSVTGGCVEGALVEEAEEVLAGGAARVRRYGISDEQAIGVGLTCGGTVHVLIHELDAEREVPAFEAVAEAVDAGRPAARATIVDGAHAGATLTLVDAEVVEPLACAEHLDQAVERDARGSLAHGMSILRRYGEHGEVMDSDMRVFIHAFVAPPSMVIFGAIDFSAAVAALAKTLGYRVTVCDARRRFAEGARFRVADEVAVEWPAQHLERRTLGPRDVVLVFTHDPKFDEQALAAALGTGCGYIGALGSRTTHEDRTRRLIESGVPESELARISSPCGLDIGARSPEETAVSIMAEIIARFSGRSGLPLEETDGPIHSRSTLPRELA
jgi:xanthine dehydrogenase accessory factor